MQFTGLTDKEVLESREKNGANVIPDSEPTTFWAEFCETFNDPMIRILLVIAGIMTILSFIHIDGKPLAEWFEPVGTFVAVLIVATVSAKTGVASDTKFRELKESTEKDKCKVYRNGLITVVNFDDVVVGDKVYLQAGDKVPADGILVDGSMKVDNSALNGEAEECKKTATSEKITMPDEITGDAFVDAHSLFRGVVLFDGAGVLDVQKVGLKTMMGKMAEDMVEPPDSPLKVKLAKLADQISTFGYWGAGVIVLLYMFYNIFVLGNQPAVDAAITKGETLAFVGGFTGWWSMGWATIIKQIVTAVSLAIVIIVCAVPEGLPLMISLVLMQNTGKMLDHNVLVRKDQGIETAGSLNILFSDKTGTITKGKLEVVDFICGSGKSMSLEDYRKCSKLKGLIDLIIGRNTQSMFDKDDHVIGGNMTDQALLKFVGRDVYENLGNIKKYEVTKAQPFNSANKFSQAFLEGEGKVLYKGAPERLLACAKKYLDENGEEKDIDLAAINKKIDELAEKSMRVLSFGYSTKPMEENKINDDVILVGLVAIRDDVRKEAAEAIQEVMKAGIQVVMITGDRRETAQAIAKDAGLLVNDTDKVLTSEDLNKMSDDEVKAIIPNIRVIARALPTDKSRMVRLCQEMNLVVGMTGDGVNDSPALKRADVGFAMGSGTEAAKEAGEVVILDDNFKSIKDAILYGRTIYNNILKFCKFQLVINVGAVIVSAIAPFFGIEEPLKVTHLLFVNLVMDSLGAIMLGNEPALEKYMLEKPRQRDESIVSSAMLTQIIIMGIWVTILSFLFLKLPFFLSFFGGDPTQPLSAAVNIDPVARLKTAYFVLFIWAALFNGFNVRDEKFGIFSNLNLNPGFIVVFLSIVIIQALIVNVGLFGDSLSWVGKMFSCVPFDLKGWGVVILLAATMIPVDLIRKCFVKGKK